MPNVPEKKRTPVIAIASYTFLEALRNRLFWLMLSVLLTGVAMTEFIGALAITESAQLQSGFLGALLRAAAVLVVCLSVVTSMVREINDKGLELVLSLPITRARYLMGKLAGFSLVAFLSALVCTLCLLVYAPPAQVFLWGISLVCELMIVTALSLLCLLTFTQVTAAVFAVMAFYVLSRAMDALQLMGRGPLADTGSLSQQFINAFIDGMAFILPELSRFTPSEWLIYHTGEWSALAPIVVQTVVYLVLLAGAALFDLYRKDF